MSVLAASAVNSRYGVHFMQVFAFPGLCKSWHIASKAHASAQHGVKKAGIQNFVLFVCAIGASGEAFLGFSSFLAGMKTNAQMSKFWFAFRFHKLHCIIYPYL